MSLWPLDLKYGPDSPVALDVYDERLTVSPLNSTTLEYAYGSQEQPKLVGVSEEANLVRLVPTVGANPLLIFPQRSLLCPANSKLKTVLRLPLFIKVGVGIPKDIREIADISPPTTSRALYGPVDAGVLCTSVKSEVAVTIDALRSEAGIDVGSETRGDDPEMSSTGERMIALDAPRLTAFANLTITNRTDQPREVGKIMVPHDLLALYEGDGMTRTSHIKMSLLSEAEAELDVGPCPDAEASPIDDLHGRPRVSDGRKHLFDLTYRNKTGLEYGF